MSALRDVVIVADDDKMVVTLVTDLLRKRGFNVFQAFDAMQAMLGARQQIPKALILDISMPGGSGIDVLKKLRGMNTRSQVPVIILTGSADPKIEEEVRALGANEFLRKPVNLAAIDAALQRVLGLPPDPETAKATAGAPLAPYAVMTVIEAKVPAAKSDALRSAYAALSERAWPDGLLSTQLLRDTQNQELWRIESLWGNRAQLDAMRAKGTPAGIQLLKDLGVESTIKVFERVASKP